ncbi:hypothetical protein OOK13_43620 [Streptomyces sp. NBC_00378]|uniref:hypothetical protein n=1 Tax=unclassified Streptomyces TaxID=2593676 RepID=UPI00224DC2CA|nr:MULTISPECIES: hypothetical protein [unclassified Streptomyces]MCX5115219.1 hypothetical protein [Streptomyces sp. NBC_00378]
MAILGDEFMTPRLRLSHPTLAVCASMLVIALASGCTGEGSDPREPSAPASSPEQQKHPSGTSVRTEERLGRQVQEALGTEEVSDSDPLFIEAGLERVSDGFHTEPELTRGRSYRLTVACAGKGQIVLSIAGKDPVRQKVDCDGVPLRQRLTASAAKIRIDSEAIPGSTGMVAWRLDKADK